MKSRIVFGAMVSLAALFATPAAQAQLSYTTNADNVSLTIIGYAGPPWAVVIPTNINGLTVISIGDRAFYYSDVINVTISDTVTNIGENAFEFCECMTNVTIGTNVASIGEGAFATCTSLTDIVIPSGVTNLGDYAFYECDSFTNVTIPASVTSLGDGAFSVCTNLSNVTLPASLASIGGGAFAGCFSLPSITIPASVTNIGEEAFAAVPSIATSGVAIRCASLTAINVDAQNSFYSSSNGVLFDKSVSTLLQYPGGISGGYTIPGSVTSIAEEAFFGAALTSVTIPGGVTNFGDNAFAYCTSLTNLTMANGVTSIGGDASLYVFQGCSNLNSITIPGSVTNISDEAFAFCRSLTNVYFQGNAPVRRAPKVTVTRGGDTLCQKGCYPLALVFY